jgi:hypothetical protein
LTALFAYFVGGGQKICPAFCDLCTRKQKTSSVMIIETGKIERGDRVYASMIKSGKVLAELRCDTTVSGMTDVYKALCRLSPMVKGFVKVSVSNRTRGWSKTLSLLVGREMPSASHKEMIAAGLMERDGQLCIPFN